MTRDLLAVVSSGANARTFSKAMGLPTKGWLVSVVPTSNPEAPHGRIYARLLVTVYAAGITPPNAIDLAQNTVACLWAGYVTPGVPSSLCAYPLADGYTAVIDVTEGQNGSATDLIQFAIETRSEVVGGTLAPSIYFEAPGSGIGEQFTDSQSSNPGVENVFQALAFVRWRLREIRYKLVTDANAANRSFTLDRKGKSPGFLESSSLVSYSPVQAATLTKFYSFKALFQTEGAKDLNATYPGIGEIVLNGQQGALGDRLVTNTTNLQVGDTYTRAENYEEWAMPAP